MPFHEFPFFAKQPPADHPLLAAHLAQLQRAQERPLSVPRPASGPPAAVDAVNAARRSTLAYEPYPLAGARGEFAMVGKERVAGDANPEALPSELAACAAAGVTCRLCEAALAEDRAAERDPICLPMPSANWQELSELGVCHSSLRKWAEQAAVNVLARRNRLVPAPALLRTLLLTPPAHGEQAAAGRLFPPRRSVRAPPRGCAGLPH